MRLQRVQLRDTERGKEEGVGPGKRGACGEQVRDGLQVGNPLVLLAD